MAASDDETKRLFEGLDYLGKPSDIGLTGQSDVPAGTTGLPAPSAPGGMSGFAGGPGRAAGEAGRAAGGPGGPGSLGLAKSALEAAIKSGKFAKELFPDQETRGSVGGSSLSDQLRSMLGGAGGVGSGGASAISGAGSIGAGPASGLPMGTLGGSLGFPGVSDEVIMNMLSSSGLGAEGIQGLLGEMNIPQATSGLAAPSAIGGAEGLAGGLSTAGAGGAALGAILGLLAQATGDPGLAQAAKLVGAGTGAIGLGSTAAGLTSLAPLLGTATAAVPTGVAAGLGGGAATGLAAGGAAGLGTAAGAAAAPIAAFLLASMISGLAGGEDPIGEGIGEMMEPLMGRSPKFPGDLARTTANSTQMLQQLQQALPYVQSQEELGQLLNTYKNAVGSANAWTNAQQFGSADPYQVGTLPGATGTPHEGGLRADFGPQLGGLQSAIDALRPLLPGSPITAQYGQPGGGFEGPDLVRLWQQFGDRAAGSPVYEPGTSESQIGAFNLPADQIIRQGFYGAPQSPEALRYGQEGYPYGAPGSGGLPAPGQYVGSVSPYWQQIMSQQQQAANPLAAQVAAMIGGGTPAPGTGIAEGLLPEEERRRLSQ